MPGPVLNFTISVAAGNVLPTASYATGSGIWAGTAGLPSNITVSQHRKEYKHEFQHVAATELQSARLRGWTVRAVHGLECQEARKLCGGRTARPGCSTWLCRVMKNYEDGHVCCLLQ